ncbi:MAG: hypothetical protein ACI8TE_000712 [Francisella sp.]|jgi:hypothetical protein
MKKTLICSLLAIAIATASFANDTTDATSTANIASGSSAPQIQTESIIKAPAAMNALPVNKNIDENAIQMVDQPKQAKEKVGSNSATWTPAYLKVDNYKNCLDIQEYRGWEGLCMPTDKPKNCPSDSWSQLQEMNLVPCTKDAS